MNNSADDMDATPTSGPNTSEMADYLRTQSLMNTYQFQNTLSNLPRITTLPPPCQTAVVPPSRAHLTAHFAGGVHGGKITKTPATNIQRAALKERQKILSLALRFKRTQTKRQKAVIEAMRERAMRERAGPSHPSMPPPQVASPRPVGYGRSIRTADPSTWPSPRQKMPSGIPRPPSPPFTPSRLAHLVSPRGGRGESISAADLLIRYPHLASPRVGHAQSIRDSGNPSSRYYPREKTPSGIPRPPSPPAMPPHFSGPRVEHDQSIRAADPPTRLFSGQQMPSIVPRAPTPPPRCTSDMPPSGEIVNFDNLGSFGPWSSEDEAMAQDLFKDLEMPGFMDISQL